jgi:hypothetical protein
MLLTRVRFLESAASFRLVPRKSLKNAQFTSSCVCPHVTTQPLKDFLEIWYWGALLKFDTFRRTGQQWRALYMKTFMRFCARKWLGGESRMVTLASRATTRGNPSDDTTPPRHWSEQTLTSLAPFPKLRGQRQTRQNCYAVGTSPNLFLFAAITTASWPSLPHV